MLRRATLLLGSDSLGSSLATQPQTLSKVNAGSPAKQGLGQTGEGNIGSASPYAVTYTVPSKSANAPRVVDSSHYKQAVPFQKTTWSPTAEDIPSDSIAERPQAELQVFCRRDEVLPIPLETISLEDRVQKRRNTHTRRRALWNKITRMGKGKKTEGGLLVRDETYWKWWVQDGYGFIDKPNHLTWEQFAEELESFSFHWELHPTKPEDYYILHLVRRKGDDMEVVWSAEHAAWQSPLLVDMYAALGTMMARRLKTRTISFDNSRGTIGELNIQHVSPYTSAVQINARPSYFYDAHLREEREENSSWYFTKELQTLPGIDEDGTVSFYASGESLAYHLSASVKALLDRPMWMFYRRAIRKNAKHRDDYFSNSDKVGHAMLSWTAWDDQSYGLWPATCQLDAITDHWLEESPFPLRVINNKIRKLARMRPQNLESRQFLDSNISLTKQAGTQLLATHAPQLLLSASEGGNDFIHNLLKEDTMDTERTQVYRQLTPGDVEELMLLRESDDAKERQQEEEEHAREQERAEKESELARKAQEKESREPEVNKTIEELGRERLKRRIADGETSEDSEQWEWYHRNEEVKPKASPMGAVEL
eukprot:TRINITY_DN4704_c0_g2_i1.p1 TRINITY_DN4704_c0_g2~~TRINITY_DN4704_c0_g2_i1.p1  ORF type:complete len:595 (+),score=143.30 TRINITY_DN4704_c0_g2_i1:42-1826(+)